MFRYTLTKAERLSSLTAIGKLFADGKSVSKYPLRIVWLEADIENGEAQPPVQVLFSVSKKKFKKAVDRNRIKRLMREAYRLGKHEWHATLPPGRFYYMALLYTGTEILSFEEIQNGLKIALKRWLKDITAHPERPSSSRPS